ncbi:hypothetical protein ABTF56_21165, partial [Acinetobacter baumannii]
RALALNGDAAIRDEAFRFFTAYAARAAAGEKNAVADMVDYWFGAASFDRVPAPVQAFLDASAAKNARDVVSSFAETLAR